jgi:hypothetical protein
VRSRLAWLLGLAGLLALVRRRRAHAAAVGPALESPADELRRRLDAAREDDAPEPQPASPEPDLDERRREVHDAARAAVDEMRATPEE